jgi:nitrogen fixation-related uncharacterized protein
MTANIPDKGSPEWDAWAAEHPLHKAVVGRKATQAITAMRVEQCLRWISTCRTRPTMLQLCAEHWGVNQRQFDDIHAEAVRRLKEKFNQDRPDFLSQKLEQLEHLIQAGLDSGQLSAAAGAMGMLLRSTGCDQPTPPKR